MPRSRRVLHTSIPAHRRVLKEMKVLLKSKITFIQQSPVSAPVQADFHGEMKALECVADAPWC